MNDKLRLSKVLQRQSIKKILVCEINVWEGEWGGEKEHGGWGGDKEGREIGREGGMEGYTTEEERDEGRERDRK